MRFVGYNNGWSSRIIGAPIRIFWLVWHSDLFCLQYIQRSKTRGNRWWKRSVLVFYYNTEYDDLDLVGQYWLRGGWEWRDRYITEVFYVESVMECFEVQRFHTSHEITGEQTDIVDEDPDDMFYTATWVESYPSTTYYVNRQESYLDDYYAEYNQFVMTRIRIMETELILFRWDDVSNDEDDYAVKGAKMAEALISSKQEFIKPLDTIGADNER